MPKIKDIYNIIDGFAPFSTQCEWDNSGILAGDPEKEITKAVFTLDITADAIAFAKENGAGLIVSHHPVIFGARKAVLAGDPVFELIEAGIGAISVHTPLDAAKGGVNDILAEKLGFDNVYPLAEIGEEAMIRIAEFVEEKRVRDIAAACSASLGGAVRFSLGDKMIKKAALCGGSAADLVPAAAKAGAGLFITGDCSHHAFLDAAALGVAVIAAGHYETENPAAAALAGYVSKQVGIPCLVFGGKSPCETIIK